MEINRRIFLHAAAAAATAATSSLLVPALPRKWHVTLPERTAVLAVTCNDCPILIKADTFIAVFNCLKLKTLIAAKSLVKTDIILHEVLLQFEGKQYTINDFEPTRFYRGDLLYASMYIDDYELYS